MKREKSIQNRRIRYGEIKILKFLKFTKPQNGYHAAIKYRYMKYWKLDMRRVI
jgi:hypothetical protein